MVRIICKTKHRRTDGHITMQYSRDLSGDLTMDAILHRFGVVNEYCELIRDVRTVEVRMSFPEFPIRVEAHEYEFPWQIATVQLCGVR